MFIGVRKKRGKKLVSLQREIFEDVKTVSHVEMSQLSQLEKTSFLFQGGWNMLE